jgi:hypothetical protein
MVLPHGVSAPHWFFQSMDDGAGEPCVVKDNGTIQSPACGERVLLALFVDRRGCLPAFFGRGKRLNLTLERR